MIDITSTSNQDRNGSLLVRARVAVRQRVWRLTTSEWLSDPADVGPVPANVIGQVSGVRCGALACRSDASEAALLFQIKEGS